MITTSQRVRPKKVGTKNYPLALPTFGVEEIEAAKDVLDSGRLTMGEEVRAFETEFAQWTGSKYAVMVNSGSSANLLMTDSLLRRSKVKAPLSAGDEVIVPALTWPTTVWPILQLGMVPIFVDIDPQTLAVDLKSVESVLSPKTKAIFLVHVLGQIPRMSEYLDFCDRHGLILLEDACESLGAFDDGKHAGKFGMMGSFSTYFSHHISTVEGGVIITSDQKLHDDLLSLRSHGWIRNRSDRAEWSAKCPEIDPRFMFIMGGYNVRPTEIQAAIGRVQLGKLDMMLTARERLAREVHAMLQRYVPWITLVGSEHLPKNPTTPTPKNRRQNSWMALAYLLDPKHRLTARQVMLILEQMGIETRPIIAGNLARHFSAQTYHIKSATSLENSDAILQNGFMIGCHPLHTDQDLQILEDAFKRISVL